MHIEWMHASGTQQNDIAHAAQYSPEQRSKHSRLHIAHTTGPHTTYASHTDVTFLRVGVGVEEA